MTKIIHMGKSAQEKLMQGVQKLASAVKITLGPKGRNAILDLSSGPLITNDGVTIAKNIFLEDETENLGAQVIKTACKKTNDSAGDGTTTATILAESIFCEGIKYINEGANPIMLRHGIKKAVDFALDEIKTHAKPVKDSKAIKQVATISSGSEEVGELIARAYDLVGLNGSLLVEPSASAKTSLQYVEGVRLPVGFISPYMCVDGKNTDEIENPYILITDKRITHANEILPIMEQVSKAGGSLLVLCEDVESDALNTILVNNVRKTFHCMCIKTPFYAERRRQTLNDLAFILNANVISAGIKNLEETTLQDLGRCKKVRIEKDVTTFIGKNTEKEIINARIEELKAKRKTVSDYEKEDIDFRINMLCGGVAIIKIGANSEIELNENKLRLEDAICATASAIEEGVIVGGGTAYIKIIPPLLNFVQTLNGDEKLGGEIVLTSLSCPLNQIVQNAGVDPSEIIEKVKDEKEYNIGYNASTNQICDLEEAGVLDPFKVTRISLLTASSVASTLLTTECVVAEKQRAE